MRALLDDVRHAFSAVLKRPKLLAAIGIPLALGIGANSAIFGVVDATLFRPLPVREPERLVRVYATDRSGPTALNNASYPAYADYRDGVQAFAAFAAYSDPYAIHVSSSAGRAERVPSMLVSANYFETLGVAPTLGRFFETNEDRVGEGRVVVLSDGFWRRRFGGDPGALGASIRLDGRDFAVVGVAPSSFTGIDIDTFDRVPDLWVPISSIGELRPEWEEMQPLTGRGFGWLYMVGRLAPGATLPGAQTELDVVAAEHAAAHAGKAMGTPYARAIPAVEAALDPTSDRNATRIAWLLFGIVSCVLLIACVDAAGLLVARGEERQRELAIRLAVGASRWRLVRQLLLESLIVSGVAAIAGLLVAGWIADLFAALAPPGFLLSPEVASPVAGPRVLIFTAAVAVLVGLLFGTLPSMRASKVDLVPALKSEVRFVAPRGPRVPLRSVFLVVQVGLSVVLLAGAILLLRTIWNAYHVDPGYETAHLGVATVDLARQGYDRAEAQAVFARILDEVRALPGIRQAALSYSVPVSASGMRTSIEFDGVEPDPEAEAELVPVGPGFFATLGVPVLRGRDVLPSDTNESAPVLVVNSAFAERFWPGEDPIGKRIANAAPNGAEVVGVVGDYAMRSLRGSVPPAVFMPHTQFRTQRMTIAFRAVGDPAAMAAGVQAAVARIDPELPVYDVGTGESKVGVALAQERVVAWLLGTFATLAAVLTATGFYGAFAYQTRLRRREFAIRAALGARSVDLLASVLRRGVTLASVGVAVGVLGAFVLSESLASLLFGVTSSDVASFFGAAALLVAVPALACYLPARRASRVDPAASLREE
jgi:putative ABC transport system permease protein